MKMRKKEFIEFFEKQFIKTLYEGLEKGALKTYDSGELYSAQFLSQKDFYILIIYDYERNLYLLKQYHHEQLYIYFC